LIHVYEQMEKMTFDSTSETILCQSIIKRLIEIGIPEDVIGTGLLRELMDQYIESKPQQFLFPGRE
jgi:hypothetical protein